MLSNKGTETMTNSNRVAVIDATLTVMVYDSDNLAIGHLTEYFDNMTDAMTYASSLATTVEIE
jgi:protein associated with RNAse G/E